MGYLIGIKTNNIVTYNEFIYENILFKAIISNKVNAIIHKVPPPTAFAIISTPFIIVYSPTSKMF